MNIQPITKPVITGINIELTNKDSENLLHILRKLDEYCLLTEEENITLSKIQNTLASIVCVEIPKSREGL